MFFEIMFCCFHTAAVPLSPFFFLYGRFAALILSLHSEFLFSHIVLLLPSLFVRLSHQYALSWKEMPVLDSWLAILTLPYLTFPNVLLMLFDKLYLHIRSDLLQ